MDQYPESGFGIRGTATQAAQDAGNQGDGPEPAADKVFNPLLTSRLSVGNFKVQKIG
jgi:hypothetical protein